MSTTLFPQDISYMSLGSTYNLYILLWCVSKIDLCVSQLYLMFCFLDLWCLMHTTIFSHRYNFKHNRNSIRIKICTILPYFLEHHIPSGKCFYSNIISSNLAKFELFIDWTVEPWSIPIWMDGGNIFSTMRGSSKHIKICLLHYQIYAIIV